MADVYIQGADLTGDASNYIEFCDDPTLDNAGSWSTVDTGWEFSGGEAIKSTSVSVAQLKDDGYGAIVDAGDVVYVSAEVTAQGGTGNYNLFGGATGLSADISGAGSIGHLVTVVTDTSTFGIQADAGVTMTLTDISFKKILNQGTGSESDPHIGMAYADVSGVVAGDTIHFTGTFTGVDFMALDSLTGTRSNPIVLDMSAATFALDKTHGKATIQLTNCDYISIIMPPSHSGNGIELINFAGSSFVSGTHFIHVSTGCDHIYIEGGETSYILGAAISVDDGITNVFFNDIEAHHCGSTALYHRGVGGCVTGCSVHHCGNDAFHNGDAGGIGLQGGYVFVSGNEVYECGSEANNDMDFAISHAPDLGTIYPLYIIGNYVHDNYGGGIQIGAVTSGSAADNSVIAGNILVNNARTDYAGAVSTGKFAAIKISGYVDSAVIANNLIANHAVGKTVSGKWPALNYGQQAGSNQNGLICNNIFYNCEASYMIFLSTTNPDLSNTVLSHNYYYRASGDYTDGYMFQGGTGLGASDSLEVFQTNTADSVDCDTEGSFENIDPLIVDFTTGELSSSSPCIGTGRDNPFGSKPRAENYQGKALPDHNTNIGPWL